MSGRSPVASVAGVALLGAISAVVIGAGLADFVNYDSTWALIWGRDLAEGDLTGYGGGPTPHPLTIALAALLSPLGEHSAAAVLAWILGYLALGLLAFMTFRLTRALSTLLAAIVATVLVLANWVILMVGAAAYLDVLFAALVITALTLEVERPRRGIAPLAVLALAGLLRPEAWGLAGLYWLYLLPGTDLRARLRTLALVAAPPFVWVAMDTAVEGRPLYSLTSTRYVADQLYGRFSVLENLRQGFDDLQAYLPAALLVCALAGAAVLVRRRARAAVVPLATLVVMSGFFVFLAVAGLPTNARYLLVPVVVLAVLVGVAAGDWTAGPRRPALLALGAAVSLVVVVHMVRQADDLGAVDGNVRAISAPWSDLRDLAEQPAAANALRASRVVGVPSPVAKPYVMYAVDRPSIDVVRFDRDPSAGVLIRPRSGAAASVISRARFGVEPVTVLPPGHREIAQSPHWSLSAASRSR